MPIQPCHGKGLPVIVQPAAPKELKPINMDSYTAKDIKILRGDESLRFDYELVQHLAKTYNRPVEFIKRSVEACRLAGVCPRDYFEARYLKGDLEIPFNPDVAAISRELQRAS